MYPRTALRVLALALMTACKPAATAAPPGPAATATAAPVTAAPTTVFFVRHGEKARDDPRDPSLSPEGEARAAVLAEILGEVGVTHLFATEFRRTQATLRPLAAASGREVAVVPAADGQGLLTALRGLPAGSIAVVAGHSNTIPGLVRELGGDPRGDLDEDTFNKLFVVIVPPAGAVQTLRLRYGAGR